MLSVVVSILQSAGFEFNELKISGNKNSTPKLKKKIMFMIQNLINQIIGIDMNPKNCFMFEKIKIRCISKR